MTTGEGLRVGRIIGAPVILRPSWFLIAALITVLYVPLVRHRLPGLRVAAYLVAFTFALLLLLSVLLHELAHALTARATGQTVTHIVLDVWGGHTVFAEESVGPGRSALVAAVGPASNALLAGMTALPLAVTDPRGVGHLLLGATATANGVVAALNALPGLPLDGGRLVEALVWRVRRDRDTGTLVAGWCGRVVTVVLVVSVVAIPARRGDLPDPATVVWLLLVAGLLWQGAGQAVRLARWRQRVPTLTVRRLLRPAVTVTDTASVAETLVEAGRTGVGDVVVLSADDEPVAVVSALGAGDPPPRQPEQTSVLAVAEALTPGAVVSTEWAGEYLLERMRSCAAPRYVVRSPDGAVVGILAWNDVLAALGTH